METKQFIVGVTFMLFMHFGFAQIKYSGTNNSGTNASAIGTSTISIGNSSFTGGISTTASGQAAFAHGYYSSASGNRSIALGEYCEATHQSYAIGQFAKAIAEQSIALGRFVTSSNLGSITIGCSQPDYALNNRIANSLMIGFNSTVPTLFVGTSPNSISAGKVGIGTSSPLYNLHILSNTSENAVLYIQNKEFESLTTASLLLGNPNHGIVANSLYGLVFKTQKYYMFNEGNVGIGVKFPMAKLHVTGTSLFQKVGIGTTDPLTDLQVNGSVSIGYEAAMPTEAKSLIVSGNVGIGTFTPSAKLDVAGKVKAQNLQFTTGFNTGYVMVSDYQGNASWVDPTTVNAGAWIRNGNNIYVAADKKIGIGTQTPSELLHVAGNALITGDIKGGHNDWQSLNLYGNSSESDGARIMIGNSSAANGGFIKMFAVGNNGGIEFSNQNMAVMSIRANNDIVIGNPTISSNMYVNGDITANLVRVNTQSWWDCVFNEDYKLLPLAEVEAYIAQHKHLPEIPSEAEVKANGIDIAQMNALLLKKVEELTLYVIELEKRVNEISK